MVKRVDIEEIANVFESIRQRFQHLSMELVRDDSPMDLSMEIPEQAALAFRINLNLQGDELHLVAGGFWLEWFPASDPAILAAYCDAVTGLLSGTYRIVEHRRSGSIVRADLQKPRGSGWSTIGRYSRLSALIPLRTTTTVLQNASAPE